MPSWIHFMPGAIHDPRQLDSVRLVSLCAGAPDNAELWAEFLRRFAAKIRVFIRGTLKQCSPGAACSHDSSVVFDAAQETDLFQSTIVRLVENNCAALRRFSGNDEADFLAYVAVVARSTVRDFLRKTRAAKRVPLQARVSAEDLQEAGPAALNGAPSGKSVERSILARELAELTLRVIDSHSGGDSARDRLIFELYFVQDLSAAQIARCKGIGLTKTGVEKALNRLKGRVRSAAATSSSETVKFG